MSRTHSHPDSVSEPIAIVGMASLLPEALDRHAYWRNILAKRTAIDDAPDHWIENRMDETSDDLDRLYTKRVALLGDLAEFDPLAFGVVPNSIPSSEPDHFLALRLAGEALVDSGYGTRDFDRSNTGVILGRGATPNRGGALGFQSGLAVDQTTELIARIVPNLDDTLREKVRRALIESLPKLVPESGPGLVSNVAVGRIANRLDLQGPSYMIDAACSSSLIAVEQAMKELRIGSCRMMLAGGVQASMPPQVYMLFCQLHALSRSAAKPFDLSADGTVLAEGVGFLVLKRLSDAEADGDTIHAVIRGCGLASDGRAQGLLTPRLEGEMLAIRRAYEATGLDPATVGLIEAHGTGIPLGDQTEMQALRGVFPASRNGVPSIAIGSVKSMIGHCIPAAGIASLVKIAQSLRYKILPPTLCESVRPEFLESDNPFYVNTEARPWIHGKAEYPRRAGVNAFGFGGINAHVILEEYEPAESVSGYVWPSELFLFSAETPEALMERLATVRAAIAKRPELELAGVSRHLAEQPVAGPARCALVADNWDSLQEKLESAMDKIRQGRKRRLQTRTGIILELDAPDQPDGKTAFLFPGQGSQYRGMLAELCMAFPSVRREFDLSDRAFDGVWEVLPSQIIFPPPTGLDEQRGAELESWFHRIDAGLETIFTANLAMFRLLGEFGLEADIMVGHSTGEYSALTAAGTIEEMPAERQVETKRELNRHYREMNFAEKVRQGVLLTVGNIPEQELYAEVEGSAGRIAIAMDNCPSQKILFGAEEDIVRLQAKLKGMGGLCQVLPFGYAYHTPHLEPMRDSLLEYYGRIPFAKPKYRVYSCASVDAFPEDTEGLRELAVRQWYTSVRFEEAIRALHEKEGVRHFVEVGPDHHLTAFVDDVLRKQDYLAVASNSRSQPATEGLQRLLARLWCRGFQIDFAPLYRYRRVESVDPFATPETADGKAKRAMVLDVSMPKMDLPGDLVTELQARMRPAPEPSVAAPESHPAAPISSPETTVQDETRAAIALEHQRLMQEFLASQQNTFDDLVRSVKPDEEQ